MSNNSTKDWDKAARDTFAVFSPGLLSAFNSLYMGEPHSKGPELKKPASHPAWQIGESVIYAKDERTALKYAKKRGLWKPEMTVKPL